ncbi:MAG: helix-turn-helix domain-containing protein [Cyanobacteria bacterium P01_A01_bin.68]
MTYTIPNNNCSCCDRCSSECPTGAIKKDDGDYWIDPSLCNDCEGYYPEPRCALVCPTNSPMPLQPKKGRCKVKYTEATSPYLFANGKTNPFASSIVIWEACNLLSQRTSLFWETDEFDNLCYRRRVKQGRGEIDFYLTTSAQSEERVKNFAKIEALNIRAACIHLIFAAHSMSLEEAWNKEFVIDDRQIEKYLGLDKRKDLTKTTKLVLIKNIVDQTCSLITSINWPRQGRIPDFFVPHSRVWNLVELKHHFQKDELGCKYPVGMTFKVRAGEWAKYFLNRQACKERKAFYQYGSLPKSLLTTVMSIWQQHEGTVRLMLWLLFKTKMGREQCITVPTLMRIAYGEKRLTLACTDREERKRLLRTYESDLEVLNHHGIKPIFDPVTYPPDIQPLWAKLSHIPEDPDEALEFWIEDGSGAMRLTDVSPRGKWNMLMNGRITSFELPTQWQQYKAEASKKRLTSRRKTKTIGGLVGEQISQARKKMNLSQRDLAKLTGKSQSWIRDIENGRFKAKSEDQNLLRKVLQMA